MVVVGEPAAGWKNFLLYVKTNVAEWFKAVDCKSIVLYIIGSNPIVYNINNIRIVKV